MKNSLLNIFDEIWPIIDFGATLKSIKTYTLYTHNMYK